MPKHSGGKVGKAGSTLRKSNNKATKTKAAKTLANHKKRNINCEE